MHGCNPSVGQVAVRRHKNLVLSRWEAEKFLKSYVEHWRLFHRSSWGASWAELLISGVPWGGFERGPTRFCCRGIQFCLAVWTGCCKSYRDLKSECIRYTNACMFELNGGTAQEIFKIKFRSSQRQLFALVKHFYFGNLYIAISSEPLFSNQQILPTILCRKMNSQILFCNKLIIKYNKLLYNFTC